MSIFTKSRHAQALDRLICQTCGRPVEAEDTFCGSCGSPLGELAPPAPPNVAEPAPSGDVRVEHRPDGEAKPGQTVEAEPVTEPARPILDEATIEARRLRRKQLLKAAAFGFAAAVAVVLAIVAIAKQKDQTVAYALLGAGVAFAAAPLVAIARRPKPLMHPSRLPAALALVALFGVSAFQVAVLKCDERLGPGGDLRGCDLAGRNLATFDLTRADLRGTSLEGASLSRLAGADLEGADLSNARASGAMLTGADLRGAVLDSADLSGAVLSEVTFDGASLKGARLTGARVDGASFAEADLSGAVLDGVVFIGGVLRGAKLGDAGLTGAVLANAVLDDADLTDARLDGADLTGASLSDAVLDGASFRETKLDGASLEGASVRGADFSGAILARSNLAGASLENLNLDDVSLIGASGYSDSALAQALGISAAQLPEYTTGHEIRIEDRAAILAALGGVCRGRPIAGASPVQGSFHPLVILNGNGQTGAWTAEAQAAGWEPMAVRFAQLVACADQREVVVQRCEYVSLTSGAPGSITRYRNRVGVRVLNARTGGTVLNSTIQGSAPGACPQFAPYEKAGRIEGSEVTFEAVRGALKKLVG